MHTISMEDLRGLIAPVEGPCLSLYLPTPRSYPDNQQGPIHYRNLVDRAEESLKRHYPGAQVRGLLKPFRGLADDGPFWTHRLDGLAVLGSPGSFHVFDLPRRVPERVVAADSFHVKPLLRIAQSADRFQVLGLQRDRLRLFEGNRDGLYPLDVPGVPATVTEALGESFTVQRKEDVPGGKSAGESRPAPRGENVPPGHPAKGDDAKLDAERYFRAVDQAVLDKVTRRSNLPLVLAALPEHQAMFRRLSNNPLLVAEPINHNPATMSEQDLCRAAWACVLPGYLARLQRMSDDFGTAQARGLATADLAEAFRAAGAGRVGILLIESERTLPGRRDPATNAITLAEDPPADDLLDDLAEAVLRIKGDVVVVPAERMPTDTGLAAIYRY
jgi:hypothetical protein